MFSHVLLATDLTETSEEALRVATALARAHAGRLTILYVYVVSPRAYGPVVEEEAARTWPGALRVRARLDGLVTGLRAAGVRAEGVLRFGDGARRIAEVAEELRVDLVVTGTHARRGLARLWYGSVAGDVLRFCGVPLLAVPMRTNVVRLPWRGPRRGRPEPHDPGARTSS